MINNSVSNNLRFSKLKDYLLEFVKATTDLIKKDSSIPYQSPNLFVDFCNLWFYSQLPKKTQKIVEQNQSYLGSLGFDGKNIKEKLEEILANDKHLNICCNNTWLLCEFIGKYFVNQVALELSKEESFNENSFNFYFDQFEEFIYSEPFKVQIYSHLYNFNSKENEIKFGEILIKRLSKSEVDELIGNVTYSALYHPHNVGDFFTITELTADSYSTEKAIDEIFQKAGLLVGFLQYFKEGIIYRDYSIFSYSPKWVNEIQKLTPLGDPHKIAFANGEKFYNLNKSEIEKLRNWLKVYTHPKIEPRVADESSNLRKSLLIATEFFESSHQQKEEEFRLIHLAIALEALFSPDDQKELSFRIRQYASLFVGKNIKERKELFIFLGKIYGLRSQIVHGNFDIKKYHDGKFVTAEQTNKFSSIVRRSLIGFLVMFLRGYNNLKDTNKQDAIHKLLTDAALDNNLIRKLQKESNVDIFVKEKLQEFYPEKESS